LGYRARRCSVLLPGSPLSLISSPLLAAMGGRGRGRCAPLDTCSLFVETYSGSRLDVGDRYVLVDIHCVLRCVICARARRALCPGHPLVSGWVIAYNPLCVLNISVCRHSGPRTVAEVASGHPSSVARGLIPQSRGSRPEFPGPLAFSPPSRRLSSKER
jgi:hypothetical protein